jgi:hypothetical protein
VGGAGKTRGRNEGVGNGEEEREGERKKGTELVDDTTPVSQPILKAVVACQDLGAAGTEFERSLIVSLFKNNFPFPPSFLTFPLPSLLPHSQLSILFTFLVFYSPYFIHFFKLDKEASCPDFGFVRCFSRSAFLVACLTRSMKSTQSVIN